MLNQCILVGRLVEDPVIKEVNGMPKTIVKLTIVRGYKNATTGEYDSDEIPVTLWNGIAESTVQYCKADSTVGIKARLKVTDGVLEVIAEKVTFINTKQDED